MPTLRIPIDLAWSGATGSPGVNVWHMRGEGVPPISTDLDGIAAALETFYAALGGHFPSSMTIRFDGEAYGVGDDEGTIWTADPWTVNGIGGGDFLPPATMAYVNWRTASGGRSGRGRTFLGPLVESVLEANGTPDELFRSEAQAAVDELVEYSDSLLNGALVVYSRLQDTARDFIRGEVPNKFAVLRSRRD